MQSRPRRFIQHEPGRDAIGMFCGGGLTNEKAYLLGKIARTCLHTANIDYNGRFYMASTAAVGLRAFGLDRGLPSSLSRMAGALQGQSVRNSALQNTRVTTTKSRR